MCAMADCDLDHIDRLLERLEPLHHVDIDLDVEGIVDRIASINKRIKRGMEATLAQYGLTHPDVRCSGRSGSGAATIAARRASWRPTWSSRAAR